MPSPSVTFAFIIATAYGVVFHLIVGGDIRRLALYLLAGWLGFTLGQLIGTLAGLELLRIGPLRIVTATLGSWTALFVARFLSNRPARGRRALGRSRRQ